jgi:hypothetical protein
MIVVRAYDRSRDSYELFLLTLADLEDSVELGKDVGARRTTPGRWRLLAGMSKAAGRRSPSSVDESAESPQDAGQRPQLFQESGSQ